MRRIRDEIESAMSKRSIFKFRIYIAGDSPNSTQALANLTAFCRSHLQDRHKIEVVDLVREPKRALAESIFMTPTVVLLAPPPVRRIVGTLSHSLSLLLALGPEDSAE
jgi:circadian clock protein KaiB